MRALRIPLSTYLLAIGVSGLALGISPPTTWSATAHDAGGRSLRVVTAATAPFVLPKSDPPAGLTVDLWSEVARRMQLEFAWRQVATQPDLLQAVQRGDADVAIAAIAWLAMSVRCRTRRTNSRGTVRQRERRSAASPLFAPSFVRHLEGGGVGFYHRVLDDSQGSPARRAE